MPPFECAACEAGLYSAGRPADLAGDLCPSCGFPLEPAVGPAELVAFRSIIAQARLDAERWVDDGGSFQAEALPLPRRQPILSPTRLEIQP
jgi:hypothetical protein